MIVCQTNISLKILPQWFADRGCIAKRAGARICFLLKYTLKASNRGHPFFYTGFTHSSSEYDTVSKCIILNMVPQPPGKIILIKVTPIIKVKKFASRICVLGDRWPAWKPSQLQLEFVIFQVQTMSHGPNCAAPRQLTYLLGVRLALIHLVLDNNFASSDSLLFCSWPRAARSKALFDCFSMASFVWEPRREMQWQDSSWHHCLAKCYIHSPFP